MPNASCFCINAQHATITSKQQKHHAKADAYTTAEQLVATVRDMMETQETILVPLVAHYVPTAAQTSLNHRVLATLGVWDSRLHLVGMHEAVQGLNAATVAGAMERDLFAQEVPFLARQMISRWKRNLYDPHVAALVGHE